MTTVIPRFQLTEEANTNENARKFFKKIEQRRKKKLNKESKKSENNDNNIDVCKNEVDASIPVNSAIESSDLSLQSNQDKNVFVLGGHKFEKTQKVNRVLPNWLQNPTVISTDLKDLKLKPKHLKLSKNIKENLKRNIKYLLPVQAEVIPWLMKDWQSKLGVRAKPSRDICVSAPTGSGKTLAYVIPIVHSLEKRLRLEIRALVIVPVQELALQVAKVFKEYVKGTNLKVLVTTGGKTSLVEDQKNLVRRLPGHKEAYERMVDILVTTPGRLVEHLHKTEGFVLKYLKYLVIDEADRVIDSMQNNWLYHLERHLEAQGTLIPNVLNLTSLNERIFTPQKLLFSATLSQDPEKLKQLNLFQPKLFTSVVKSSNENETTTGNTGDFIGKFTTPAELEEFYITVNEALKPLVVCQLLNMGWKKILCFTKSGENAHRLSNLLTLLNPKLVIKEISSALPRHVREETITNFAGGKIDMLICSDLMARGVDIPGVKYVISYEPPKFIKGYIHRAGRTGRAGVKGTAVTLVTATQATSFIQKLKDVKKTNVSEMKIDEEIYATRANDYKSALKQLQMNTEEERKSKIKNLKTMKTKKMSKSRKRKQKKQF
ncbi:probable ATP-dependent RNA helicase Dbp73D [Cimex lectularius]|uniref:ATP-dependent RNA helicase n=1 Tax=Cimex lectularius TaxID=79782 RepID=A0A8I6RJI8_CIMLE|nr:probable ATP-dependent RNA helicase Dbp73D [Cimex lectularius]